MTIIKILKEVKVMIALIGVIIMECYALSQDINGTGLALAIAAIAGLGGYELNSLIKCIKGDKN